MGTPKASEIQHPVLQGDIIAMWFRDQSQAYAAGSVTLAARQCDSFEVQFSSSVK